MKRIIAAFLALIFTFSSFLFISSCSDNKDTDGQHKVETPDDSTPEKNEENEIKDERLVVPAYKDYDRGTVDFADIVYVRPDVDATVEKIDRVTECIKENLIPYLDQVAKITEIEEDFYTFLTMYSYTNIKLNADSTDVFWVTERSELSLKYPNFSKATEGLFVAAARSPYAESFENDYFGDGLIEKYANGGVYTDELVALLEIEAALETEYTTLSTSNVAITYEGYTGTYESILSKIAEDHGELSINYTVAKKKCFELYEAACAKRSSEIFVELIKTRSLIADEYGYDSYAEVAYGEIYHDYPKEKFIKFAEDIFKYILPVYSRLNYFVFSPFIYSYEDSGNSGPNSVMNSLYDLYEKLDPELFECYSYMLQHELFDCARPAENRYEGAFSTYLEIYNAPFLFATLNGSVDDVLTMAHEFGHFYDAFVNYGGDTSLDISEVSSTALEFLTVDALKDDLDSEAYKYLLYTKLERAMSSLIYQGFFALFEHYAYELEEITEESLLAAMKKAAEKMGLDMESQTTIDSVIIPHTVLYPFYVQSYCTSTAVALEIYYTELDGDGDGLEAYKTLIARTDDKQSFDELLENALLSSPFENKFLKQLADKIYYQVIGSHYFSEANKGENAA